MQEFLKNSRWKSYLLNNNARDFLGAIEMIALFLFMPTQQDKKKYKYNPPYDCLGAKFFALMVEKFI